MTMQWAPLRRTLPLLLLGSSISLNINRPPRGCEDSMILPWTRGKETNSKKTICIRGLENKYTGKEAGLAIIGTSAVEATVQAWCISTC